MHHRILHLLYRYAHIPASLVLNKIDLLERQVDALELAEILTEGFIDGQPIPKKQTSFGKLGSICTTKKDDLIRPKNVKLPMSFKDFEGDDPEWNNRFR